MDGSMEPRGKFPDGRDMGDMKDSGEMLLLLMARLTERACEIQRRLLRTGPRRGRRCGGAAGRPERAADLRGLVCEIALDLLPLVRRLLALAHGMHGTSGRDDMLMFVRGTLAMMWRPSRPDAPERLKGMMDVMCGRNGGDVLGSLSMTVTREEIGEWYAGYRETGPDRQSA